MSKQEDNRVLARSGARELSVEEFEQVSAGINHTNVCSIAVATATHTGPGDGDGCGDSDSDTSFV